MAWVYLLITLKSRYPLPRCKVKMLDRIPRTHNIRVVFRVKKDYTFNNNYHNKQPNIKLFYISKINTGARNTQ